MKENFKVVVLDCVAEQIQDPVIRKLFADTVALRFSGYGAEYPRTVLPVDIEDYFATHILICAEREGSLSPVFCYKMTAFDRSEEFGRTFPALALARAGGGEGHIRAVEKVIRHATEAGNKIGYCGSWTIHPEVRRDRELTFRLREIGMMTHYFYQLEHGISEMLIGGVLRFKTDKFQESFGYRRLQSNGEVLGEFGLNTLFAEPIVLLHLDKVSEAARAVAMKYQGLWEDRIAYVAESGRSRIAGKPKKAA